MDTLSKRVSFRLEESWRLAGFRLMTKDLQIPSRVRARAKKPCKMALFRGLYFYYRSEEIPAVSAQRSERVVIGEKAVPARGLGL
jgi:hypothetical protein